MWNSHLAWGRTKMMFNSIKEMLRHLAEFNHVQFAVLDVGVVFTYQLAHFVSRQFNVDNFQSSLQFCHRNEAISVSVDLTQPHTRLSPILTSVKYEQIHS